MSDLKLLHFFLVRNLFCVCVVRSYDVHLHCLKVYTLAQFNVIIFVCIMRDKCVFHYRQSNVRLLLPASEYCRVAVIKWLSSSVNETVLGDGAEHLIDGSEKRDFRLSFKF